MKRLVSTLAAIGLLSCRADLVPTATLVGGPPATVSVLPPVLSLAAGAEGHLIAQALDQNARVARASFTWSSANPAVATVGSDGTVTAIAPGTTTVTAAAGALNATATISVRPPDPPAVIDILPSELTLITGDTDRLTARGTDSTGRTTKVSFAWSSADPAIATVTSDGLVTAISAGSTLVTAAVGAVRATAIVSVMPGTLIDQWAIGATASSEWDPHEWSAAQANGLPDVAGCADDARAWASRSLGAVEWLELSYAQPVVPTKIEVYETWAVGAIVKVELRNVSGEYQTVYAARPIESPACPHILAIPIRGATSMVAAIRVTIDQRATHDWNEIDAVRLIGYR